MARMGGAGTLLTQGPVTFRITSDFTEVHTEDAVELRADMELVELRLTMAGYTQLDEGVRHVYAPIIKIVEASEVPVEMYAGDETVVIFDAALRTG